MTHLVARRAAPVTAAIVLGAGIIAPLTGARAAPRITYSPQGGAAIGFTVLAPSGWTAHRLGDLLSIGWRQELAASGATEASIAKANAHIRSLAVTGWRDVTPATAPAGQHEYLVTLKVHTTGATPWNDGVNTRFVTVVPGPDLPYYIGAIASSPIPLHK